MGLSMNRRRRGTVGGRVALATVLALMAAILGLGSSSATAADSAPLATQVGPTVLDIDDDIPPVRNLRRISPANTEYIGNVALIGWERPADQWAVTGYRILYSADFRPQKWMVLETDKTTALLTNLWPARDYTVIVQATSPFGGWGRPAEMALFTAEKSVYRVDAPWVVSLGDSFISGEGGRWAGNANMLPGLRNETDTGERAYYDYEEGETIEECHRSLSAMIHIQIARSLNLACSGAITRSEVASGFPDFYNDYWKPGIDFVNNPFDLGVHGPAIGQAQMLENFARDNRVKMVVLSIGGNNFHFSDIVKSCILRYVRGNEEGCRGDENLRQWVDSEAYAATVLNDVKIAILNIRQAMVNAGYSDSEWTLVQTLYPRPIAPSSEMRYTEDDPGFGSNRQTVGGCGFYDADADWAIGTVLPLINSTIMSAALAAKVEHESLRIVHMDNTDAFKGHELCSKYSYRVNGEKAVDMPGVKSWRSKNAIVKSEWMKEVDLFNTGASIANESFHPNYWGQLALRNCLRQLWNGGNIVSGGKCAPLGGQLKKMREPRMQFTRDPGLSLLNS